MPSLRYKALEKMFALIGVNRMMDKEGEQWEKLLADYSRKQQQPLKVPYKKLKDQGFEKSRLELSDSRLCRLEMTARGSRADSRGVC